jgi:cytochrome c5
MTMKQFSRFLLGWLIVASSGLLAQEVRSGAEIVEQNCLGCHITGAARAPRPDNLRDWERVFARNDYNSVVQRAYDGFGRMPARGFCMDCDRDDIERAIRAMMPEPLREQHPE